MGNNKVNLRDFNDDLSINFIHEFLDLVERVLNRDVNPEELYELQHQAIHWMASAERTDLSGRDRIRGYPSYRYDHVMNRFREQYVR